MNETTLYPATVRSAPPLGWSCDTNTLFTDENAAPFADNESVHFSIEELLEQHAREQKNQASVQPSTDGISSRTHFGNSSTQNNSQEMDISPLATTVRPGTSLRLSPWGMRAAQIVGQPCPIQQGEELTYRRSNALVRRYTQ